MSDPGRVLFAGQGYYHTWYLSRSLRKLGWTADVLNWDPNPDAQHHYHGEDFKFTYGSRLDLARQLRFYVYALRNYDIFHFSNMHGLSFGPLVQEFFARRFRPGAEIRLLKRLGKKIVYTVSGCLDGVSQTSFASWGERPICLDCSWRNRADVCSDEGNLAWGSFRNSVSDYIVRPGGNRIDFNDDPKCHEVPEVGCLDPDLWRPDLTVPSSYRLPIPEKTVKIYHAVGNFDARSVTHARRNIKSTHIYVPLVEELKREGRDVEMIFFSDVPNRNLRFYQVQADIVVDMLTYGFSGANVREAMMLGKPVICYLRPEWLDQMRDEVPDYVAELPIVSATPDTVRDVLVDLIEDRDRRLEIGRASREFAVKWHSADAAARRFDAIYRNLLAGQSDVDDFG